jgi:hypothetical protein
LTSNARLRNYFIYGRSIDNQRIESWWGQLASSSLFVYHQYFNELLGDGIYSKECIPEQVSRSIFSTLYLVIPTKRYLDSTSCCLYAYSTSSRSIIC